MAIFLDRSNSKREKERLTKAKSLYFSQLYDQLIMMAENILWYNERLADDSFDWNMDENAYYTIEYRIKMSSRYPTQLLDYEEAINRLRTIGEKYSIDNIKSLNQQEIYKINRMFQIVAAGATHLLVEAKAVSENKLILEIEDYLSIEDNKNIMFNISLAIGLMPKTDKNYKAVVECLINAIDALREIGNYTNNISTGLHGSISVTEL